MVYEAMQEGDKNKAQKNPRPGENDLEAVADGGEDGVGGVVGDSFQLAMAEVSGRTKLEK